MNAFWFRTDVGIQTLFWRDFSPRNTIRIIPPGERESGRIDFFILSFCRNFANFRSCRVFLTVFVDVSRFFFFFYHPVTGNNRDKRSRSQTPHGVIRVTTSGVGVKSKIFPTAFTYNFTNVLRYPKTPHPASSIHWSHWFERSMKYRHVVQKPPIPDDGGSQLDLASIDTAQGFLGFVNKRYLKWKGFIFFCISLPFGNVLTSTINRELTNTRTGRAIIIIQGSRDSFRRAFRNNNNNSNNDKGKVTIIVIPV